MSQHSELQTFDGLDNRKEIMYLLQRLGSDKARGDFIERLIKSSLKGFKDLPGIVRGKCDTVSAYFMFISCCNELCVPINTAARLLEQEAKRL